ncbi:MAG: biotin/lipoyl-binding protein [Porphyromonadaceae bacterium]|jgi:biotin carboxyl carrier protein|uniref:Acetyl-CoA carboxylase biotin carboxyl carrier protein subunit n=1 Tax=Porphyromonas pasteri TaxID=1583331 RepID=A0ABQ2H563_9PORP|nr:MULTISPECIES: acetyl-CoA carboxylase biotin carboxyl carrier protein subunit [Porphyromonas]MBF1288836.1 biotin/lipoyl-binding protein [Porphyromonadaceae bacterium]EJU16891.1 biotin-requiring enzyme [Porphyromonas sp. oral taxon 279 str. F0450]MBF1308221.1 biotin/lipoyl-binding protein [Porphyromonadaceae bacterium]MBF1314059.1 biotin/lipoyl-binding protein [Porphyromonadaceae bacterium]MBF1315043.1 biotin/lipoyl-binding protein [Porphyromonadaceae bacterium]
MKEYKYKINGNEYSVAIIDLEGDKAAVEVNGVSYQVDILTEGYTAPAPRPAAKPAAAPAPAPAAAPAAPAPAPQPIAPAAPAAEPAAPAGKGTAVQSPLPGVILDIKVAVGDQVKAGQTVAILEAMKMENNINAECDGVITAIKVSKGDNILEGSDIVIIG